MGRRYFWLLIRYDPDADWSIEFGDYDRQVVVEERDALSYPKRDMKIVKMDDDKEQSIKEYIANWRVSI